MIQLILPLDNGINTDSKTASACVIDIITALKDVQAHLQEGVDMPEFTKEDRDAILNLDFTNLNISLDKTENDNIMLTLK